MLIRNRVRIWTLACLNQSMSSWPHWTAFVTAQMLSQGPLVFQKPCLESLKSVLNLLFHWAFSFIEPSYSMGHCATGILFLSDQKPFSPLFSPASYTRLPVSSCCLLRLSPDVSSCTQASSSIHHALSCMILPRIHLIKLVLSLKRVPLAILPLCHSFDLSWSCPPLTDMHPSSWAEERRKAGTYINYNVI